MENKNYRIVQLSDLHLTEKDSDARSEWKLYGKLRGMNKAFIKLASSSFAKESDWVLFTGDITDNGNLNAWKFFWDALEKFDLKKKSTIIPGNHDMCCLGARLPKTEKELISEDLKKFHAGLAMGNYTASKYPNAIKLNDQIAVFAIDSCNKGNQTGVTNAMGHIGYQQLEKLARMLYKFRDIKVKIIVLHHSPNIPSDQTARKRGLEEMSDFERWGMEMPPEDRRALRLLCVAHKVRLVLHGHLHRAEDRRVNSVRYIGAPASTQPQDGKYAFYTYEVTPSGAKVNTELVTI
jgi:3',5'-cyclic AMP phosphodiesterase CpdA